MAWTTPRTWVTGETVTAALLNTHLRDNLNETAPATVTTAGDLLYATAANNLARLGVGDPDQVLIGGASAPAWSATIGDASNNAVVTFKGTLPQLRLSETDASDSSDYWRVAGSGDDFYVQHWDDSAGAFVTSLQLASGDWLLHAGGNGTGNGSVVVDTATATDQNLTSAGGNIVTVSAFQTGGAAYIEGTWGLTLERTGAGSGETITIIPRDDGSNLQSWFRLDDGTEIADNICPTVGNRYTVFGSFFKRVTADDTSDWQLFGSCDTNSRFKAANAYLYVRSIQYPN